MHPDRIRMCVWEIPVRCTHWVNVVCIVVLSITGYYIADPFIHAYSPRQYIMGTMRFIHFVAAYIFIMSLITRIYWAFMGNRYANWRAFFPFTRKKLTQIAESIRFYLLLSRKYSHILGHSALSGIVYLVIFLLFTAQIVTGFALYSQTNHGIPWVILGGWVLYIMEAPTARLYHHLIMWVIIAFSLLHLYMAFFIDAHERNGLMGSIFGGYKFVTRPSLLALLKEKFE
jgi:Ni/Fe-hydrogenase 1 B-type cytochrome subunit